MSNEKKILKPQAPLMRGSDYVMPITSADQIVLADGTRLEKDGKIIADNSNKLGNVEALDYALKSDLGISMELLWENPDATAIFNAQHLNVNHSNYDGLLLKFKQHTTLNHYYTSIVFKPDIGLCYGLGGTAGLGGAGAALSWRSVDMSDDQKIDISDCYFISTNALASASTSSEWMIPMKVYGIRGVR